MVTELQDVQSSSQNVTINKPMPSFYRPDVLPVTQTSVKALKGHNNMKYESIFQNCAEFPKRAKVNCLIHLTVQLLSAT